MPWRLFLQQFLYNRLIQSESFHRVVRQVHKVVNDMPGAVEDINNLKKNDKVVEAKKFGRILLDEMKQAALGKPPKS
ncbi:hypothetical protein V1511DRAFT_511569 [Dipodascopsis uninucleata]